LTTYRLARDDDRNIHYAWDAARPPVLTIAPGDEVVVEARSGEDDQVQRHSGTEALDSLDLSRLHALSGPIEVKGARPGHALVIDVLDLDTADWGFTMMRPGAGVLTGFGPWLRSYPIDRRRRVIEIAPAVQVPLAPFLGQMGVAPLGGPQPTIPPGTFGGNIDCREAVAGTRLRLPVFVPGALFSCGDGHAAQGDGEVCVTAVECAITARLRLGLEPLDWLTGPLLETSDAWMTFGAGATHAAAIEQALTAMLDLLGRLTGLEPEAAYALASAAVDVRVNQVVNLPKLGFRAAISKAVLPSDAAERLTS